MSRLYCCGVDAALPFEHLRAIAARPILNRAAMRSISASSSCVGDRDVAVAAVMHDQPLVDQAFEHFFAEAIDAGGGQRVAADVLAVDDRHHVVLRPLRPRQRRSCFAASPLAACGPLAAASLRGQESARRPYGVPM